MENKNNLEVKYGSIYNMNGNCIDHMGVIIDKEAGLLKYGDANGVKEYYDMMVERYTKFGYTEMIEQLVFISFDRYEGVLSVEEVCTFVNYMSMCSCLGERIMELLSLSTDDLKAQLKKYADIGY